MRRSTSRPASVTILNSVSRENRLIFPWVRSETLGWLTFSRFAALGAVQELARISHKPVSVLPAETFPSPGGAVFGPKS